MHQAKGALIYRKGLIFIRFQPGIQMRKLLMVLLDQLAETIKKTAFLLNRVGESEHDILCR